MTSRQRAVVTGAVVVSWRSRAARAQALVAAAVLVASVGLIAAPTTDPANADAVTVPFVDRLGCGGATDALVTPLFEWNGGGTAVDGGAYAATTSASAYPPTNGAFSAVSAGSQYTVYSPVGYGSDFQYRGAGALGFPAVTAASGATLTMTLPHPQALQLTVGGIDAPSRLTVSGSGPAGPVTPAAAVRGTTAGSAGATAVGDTVTVSGGTAAGADAQPAKAVDVWFAQPVTSLTVRVSGTGVGTDAGFLVTPPVACQSATVGTSATIGTAAVDAASGRVSYPVQFVTAVSNASPVTGASLHPAVTAPLTAALAAQGFSLDSVTFGAASDEACASTAAADGSAGLITPSSSSLAPGEACTLPWSAAVSAPQSTVDRSVELTTTVASSASSAARVKASTASTLTFPGLSSQLTLTETGTSQAAPGEAVPRTTTIANNGDGAALNTVVSVDTGGATPSGFSGACAFNNPLLTCAVGNLPPGGTAVIDYILTVPASASDGAAFTVSTTASSSAQAQPATSTFIIAVVLPPSPPPPSRPLPPTSVAPPLPSPARPAVPVRPVAPRPAPSATPSPAPSPRPVLPPAPVETEDPGAVSDLPMQLAFGASRLTPGTASTMRGQLGPNTSAETVTLVLTGRVGAGILYRSVRALLGGVDAADCDLATREFSCEVVLAPGESAAIEIRVLADALNAPDVAVQQVTVASSEAAQDNAVTISTDVARERDTDAWTAALRMDMSSFPGAFVPLLALLLFALAAAVAESSGRRTDTDRL